MEFVMPILEGAWRYVLTLRISDYLDIALMAYAIYWLLKLVGTSKVESAAGDAQKDAFSVQIHW